MQTLTAAAVLGLLPVPPMSGVDAQRAAMDEDVSQGLDGPPTRHAGQRVDDHPNVMSDAPDERPLGNLRPL
jgi:hypothetical protein